jgi:signal transduction histidine kinase
MISAAPAEDGLHRITFEDNGIGIAPEHHKKIFGVFERLHPRSAYEGSGIGLAVCQKIAEQHHGRIDVQSEPGRGTKFIVSLPRRQAEE